MRTFKILETIDNAESETTNTRVQFDFMEKSILIPHFRSDSDEIIVGIKNRYISELRGAGLLEDESAIASIQAEITELQ